MKKFVFLLVTIVAVLIFTSSRTTISSDSRVGTSAANFTIGNDSVVVTLDQFKGKWVIVNVWSSADAMARRRGAAGGELRPQQGAL